MFIVIKSRTALSSVNTADEKYGCNKPQSGCSLIIIAGKYALRNHGDKEAMNIGLQIDKYFNIELW